MNNRENVEFEELNARASNRIEEESAAAKFAYERSLEIVKQKRLAYGRKSIQYIATHGAICGGVGLAWAVGMVHPVISIPVMLFCLCASCVRLGAWLGGQR